MKMKVAIIEDEAVAANRLESLISEVNPEAEVVVKLASISESLQWLLKNTPDLIFADIQLSDGLSFSIFKQLQLTVPVIFTTAYDEYAIKAFEVNSIAYLLKPIRKKALIESFNKYEILKSKISIDLQKLVAHFEHNGNKVFKKRFLIRIGDQYQKIETADLAYCFAIEKEVLAKKFDGRVVPLEQTLDELENLLDPSLFFRINRKYIVQMKAINRMIALSRSRIKLILNPAPENQNDAIVSIQRSSNFKKWMGS